ncbi:hypothetical protein GJAV_G00166340 [Gymnothorax javanicus]|nr:hypothetical protein GJAV_G00166340 [Gymnothorax javanicus]
MQVPAGTLLLVACCLWTAEGQGEPPRKSIWEDPIQFNTKTKDACTMIVTGQGDLTKLRVACKNQGKEYWCEYAGKPQVCRSYNNNPRHYFTQIMWDLRKLPNACQGARVIKPQMCKRASDEAQMVFQTSWPRLFTPRPVRPTQGRQPAQARPEQPKPEAPRAEVPSPEEPKPDEARPEESRPQVLSIGSVADTSPHPSVPTPHFWSLVLPLPDIPAPVSCPYIGQSGGRGRGTLGINSECELPRCSEKEHYSVSRIFTNRWKAQGEDMNILSNIAIVLVLACIAQLVLVADCARGQGRKGKKDGRGTDRGKAGKAPKPPAIQPSARHEKERKPPSVKGDFKGRFSTKDKSQCTWVAAGEHEFTLRVNCKKGTDTSHCEYKGRPTVCPEYASSSRFYWKQIARSLKKQKTLCKDSTALVKAGMCRRAPKAAHFKLSNAPNKPQESSPPLSRSSGGKSCAELRKQHVEEYCSTSWTSVCTMLFSMVQGDEDC